MNYMRSTLLLLILSLLSTPLLAKTMCSVPVSTATVDRKENATLNDRLKNHQKIKTVSFSIDLDNLQSDKNKKIQLIFETTQAKRFETSYTQYNKALNVWKIDFSKSQIFPQLFKNYLNITQFNSKYYLRLYDNPTEKTMVNLIFDSSNCTPANSNLLSRAGAGL